MKIYFCTSGKIKVNIWSIVLVFPVLFGLTMSYVWHTFCPPMLLFTLFCFFTFLFLLVSLISLFHGENFYLFSMIIGLLVIYLVLLSLDGKSYASPEVACAQ